MGDVVSGILGTGNVSSAANAASAAEVEALDRAIAEQRRQFDLAQTNIDPFIQAGAGALGDVSQAASISGLGDRLSLIQGTDAFRTLNDEALRAASGGLAAGGLTRSGAGLQTLAGIPTSTALGIEGLTADRSANLASLGASTATGLGQIGQQSSSNISNLLAQQGVSQGAGALTGAQAEAAGISNLLSTGALGAGLYFSDPHLKENIEEIGFIADLTLYEWDWIPETKGTVVEKFGKTGFMADEVQEKYPHHVYDYCGYMTIDYPSLLNELELNNGNTSKH